MYKIKEVAQKLDISEHTLRFWAKCGFFPFVQRDKNNIRQFSEDDLGWVKIVKCLRDAGTDTKSIKKYIDLCLLGDSTIEERYNIIYKTRENALQRQQEINKQIDLLNYKVEFYQNLIKTQKKDPWNPMNAGLSNIKCSK